MPLSAKADSRPMHENPSISVQKKIHFTEMKHIVLQTLNVPLYFTTAVNICKNNCTKAYKFSCQNTGNKLLTGCERQHKALIHNTVQFMQCSYKTTDNFVGS